VNGASVSAFSIDSDTGELAPVGTYAGYICYRKHAHLHSDRPPATLRVRDQRRKQYHNRIHDRCWYRSPRAGKRDGGGFLVCHMGATVYAITAGTGALTLKINFDTGLFPTHVAFQRLP